MDIANIFWDRMDERAQETITALRAGKLPPVIRFAVHITQNCNMRCQYCNEPKVGTTMTPLAFENIMARAGTQGIIHITGGEPQTVPWLSDMIAANPSLRFALNTNMLKMPAPAVLRTIFRLKTSLDSSDRDAWNALTGGNFFDRVVANIKSATTQVKYTSVCYTATHQNAHLLGPFIDFTQREFPELFSLSVSFYKGTNMQLALTQTDIDQLFAASRNMNEVSRQVFNQTHAPTGNVFPQNLHIPCYLSLTERLIDSKGDEYYCSHLYRDHVRPPGRPGLDEHCVTGCNAKFSTYNRRIYEALQEH